jgi:hypothetical protein
VQTGRDADHIPHLVPRSRTSRCYNSSLPQLLHGVLRDSLLYREIKVVQAKIIADSSCCRGEFKIVCN